MMSSKQSDYAAYVMGYFRSGPAQTHKTEQLHFAFSRDGRRWFELNGNRPVWASSLGEGILRDPFIGRGPDGKWRLVFTIRPMGPSIGYAESDDLIHWAGERELPLMKEIPNTVNSWAPEFSYDAESGEFLIYWASSTGDHLANSKHYMARTRDWSVFSPTELFYDPGFQTIDASLAEHNGKYYMAVKDESHVYDPQKRPHPPMNFLAVADRPEGPYERIPGVQTPDYTEGPVFLWIAAKRKWLLFYDYWAYGKFGAMESEDMRRWSAELDASVVRFPYRARHATVFPVSERELRQLLDRFALLAHYRTTTYGPVRVAAWEPEGFLHDAFGLRTVTMQIRPESLSGTQVLYDEGDAANGLALRLRAGRLEGVVRSNGERAKVCGRPGSLELARWQDVALTFEDGALRLYVGGVLEAEAALACPLVRAHDAPGGYGGRFGADAFGDSDGGDSGGGDSDGSGLGSSDSGGATAIGAVFQGAIRHVRVYSVPLGEKDLAAEQ